MEEEDDLFSDMDDAAYERDMEERNYNRLRSIHATAGFREGRGEGSDGEAVQRGFNEGFREGAATAFCRSMHRALFNASLQLYGDKQEVVALKDALDVALQQWERKPIEEAALCEEQRTVEIELMPQLLRAVGLPADQCDPTRLAAQNPFRLN